MSATTFSSLCVIYMYLAGCVLQGAVLTEIRTSKACYGSVGLTCTKHSISCNSTQKIAIVDAYFTFNRVCSTGTGNCQDVSPDNVTESRRSDDFSNTQLMSLYKSCSTQSQCEHQAPRHDASGTFSIVKYVCVEVTVQVNAAGSVTVATGTESTSTKATQRILTAVSVTARSGTESTSTTGEITSSPNKEISTPLRLSVGMFMGGVASGAVIVTLVGLAVYILVIRRRYVLTLKKQEDMRASVQHPTYSGLLGGGDVNNYAVIEQTSRSQEGTTHGSTATPDYQNI